MDPMEHISQPHGLYLPQLKKLGLSSDFSRLLISKPILFVGGLRIN